MFQPRRHSSKKTGKNILLTQEPMINVKERLPCLKYKTIVSRRRQYFTPVRTKITISFEKLIDQSAARLKKSKSLFFCIQIDFSKCTNAMQFFLRKICSFPRKTRKPFQAPPSISQAENRVEIHYDSLDLHFKTTALEKRLVAKIVSITRH